MAVKVLSDSNSTEKLPTFPSQPASINFIAYDSIAEPINGEITPLGIVEEHCTTIYSAGGFFVS